MAARRNAAAIDRFLGWQIKTAGFFAHDWESLTARSCSTWNQRGSLRQVNSCSGRLFKLATSSAPRLSNQQIIDGSWRRTGSQRTNEEDQNNLLWKESHIIPYCCSKKFICASAVLIVWWVVSAFLWLFAVLVY
jgi:hypothetical protein